MKKRTFDQEYKIQAIELCLEGGQVHRPSGKRVRFGL